MQGDLANLIVGLDQERREKPTMGQSSQTNTRSSVSLVMISLNEEKAIEKVVRDIRGAVPDAEIVLVDSSTDRTADIAESLGCRVIRQVPPRGYGPALHEGLLAASGEIVVTMDCDDTYPAAAIGMLAELIDSGFDVVNASRMRRRQEGMPLANYAANRVFALLARIICGVTTSDVHSGMRAYRRTLLHSVEWNPQGMALPVELLIKPIQQGYKHKEVFIEYKERIGQTTLRPIEGTVWTIRRLWSLRRS